VPPCQTAGTNLQENYSNPQSSLHPPYITFPLLGNIHLSLDYESPQNSLASPPEPKIPIILLTCSLPLSDFIIVIFQCIYCFFVCLFAFYNFNQPLATTFNKRYIKRCITWMENSAKQLPILRPSEPAEAMKLLAHRLLSSMSIIAN